MNQTADAIWSDGLLSEVKSWNRIRPGDMEDLKKAISRLKQSVGKTEMHTGTVVTKGRLLVRTDVEISSERYEHLLKHAKEEGIELKKIPLTTRN